MLHHTHRPRRLVGVLVAVSALITASLVPTAAAAGEDALLPVVFVHGQSGSATQFESHALRLTSNGYPAELIVPFEYDTGRAGAEYQQVVIAALDGHIDGLLDLHDADQVHLAGHSRGTGVSLDYLADGDRAAKVATYTNIDGGAGRTAPEGPRTLGVWGEGSAERELVGADRNVQFADQAHTEVATSAETFAELYQLVTGEAPATTDVIPTPGEVTAAGRATIFPANLGVEGGTVSLYEVDPATGQRVHDDPDDTAELPADGAFSFTVTAGASYEFELSRDDTDLRHHFYSQPFERSNHWVRLQTSNPGQGVALLIEDGPDHTALVITRDAEWWGDQDEGSDALEIDGTDVVNEGTAPRAQRNIAVFVFDANSDGESTPTTQLPIFTSPLTTFLTGTDLYIPADDDGSGTVEVAMTPRGDEDATARVAVPNWPSVDHRVSLRFKDYTPLPVPDEPVDPEQPARFVDVAGNVHADAIRTLQLRGIVEGLDGARYGPFLTLRRDQMASIVARAMQLEPVASGPFLDVGSGPHQGAINALADRGIALGTGDGTTFSPRAEITRDQLAAFLGRALELDPVAAGPFADVHGSVHAGWVNALAAVDVVEGWSDETFRPRRPVQRDQAASMVARALPWFDGQATAAG